MRIKKEFLKRIIIRKQEGSEFVEAAFCMFATLIMLITLGLGYAVWQTQMNLNDKIDLIQTAYMKRMEATGYLTESDKTSLIHELEEAGFRDVDITGSTSVRQKYGKPIQIRINGLVDLADMDSFDVIAPVIQYIRNTFGLSDFGTLDYVNHTFKGTSKV